MNKDLMKAETLISCIDYYKHDRRLKVWHFALLVGLYVVAIRQRRITRIKISRSMVMAVSHIDTAPTYHKYLKELNEYGYVQYRPSYHPGIRTEVDLIILWNENDRLIKCSADL